MTVPPSRGLDPALGSFVRYRVSCQTEPFLVFFVTRQERRRIKLGAILKKIITKSRYIKKRKIHISRFLKTGLAKISTHSTTWQFKTTKLIQRPIKSLYMTPGSTLMVPRSIPTSPNLK